MSKTKLSFKEIIQRISRQRISKPDLVIGIARGGITLAAIIAYKLKSDLKIIKIKYRDRYNNPKYKTPKINLSLKDIDTRVRKVLVVDDVSVTGQTLNLAKTILKTKVKDITTLVLKGKADKVLFPEVKGCIDVDWR